MSTVWFTSDMHIGHKLVARERFDRAHRDFVFTAVHRSPEEWDRMAVEWHDATLAKNWDAAVSKDDTVIVVGDITSGASTAQRFALDEWFPARPGRKILVPGNHDGIHPSNRDADKWFARYAKQFAFVAPFSRRKVAGRNVMLSHFPYNGDHTPEDRFTQYRLVDEGLPVIHGHTHSENRVSRSNRGTLQIHVGVDAWNMAPVSLVEIERMVSADVQVIR